VNIPVFVINLQKSVERRDHTTRQLNDLEIPFQIVDAIDGSGLSEQEIRNNSDYGIYRSGFHSNYLRREEIACSLSHIKVFRKMISEKIELACILEDDVEYLPGFRDLLANIRQSVYEWDILYMGHHSACTESEAQCRNKKQIVNTRFYFGEAIEVPYGAYAYIINIEAAKRLLSIVFPLRMPFDSYIGNAPAIGLRTFLISPCTVEHRSDFKSTIHLEKDVIYSNHAWKVTGIIIEKLYLWLPFLRTIRVWIYINSRAVFRYLRKKGIIKNNYARLD
jgi:glycosyl transferase, family 25